MSEHPVGDGRPSGDYTRPVASGTGFREWEQPSERLERAFVLAGGGATGIAWEAGVILGLRDGGIDVRDADTMIGTSAGSMVAAHLRIGTDEGNAFARIREGAPLGDYGRLGAADATRYLRAQLHPDPRRGRSLVGQAALSARTTTEEEWLEAIGLGLVGKPWPERRLLVTAVDAASGTSVVFDSTSGVPLERAVAASCAVPGVFPAVEIAGRRYVDGGPAQHRQRRPRRRSPPRPRPRALPGRPAPARPPRGAAARAPAEGPHPPRRPRRPRCLGHGGQPARHEPRGRHLRDGARPRPAHRPSRRPRSGPTDAVPDAARASGPSRHRVIRHRGPSLGSAARRRR